MTKHKQQRPSKGDAAKSSATVEAPLPIEPKTSTVTLPLEPHVVVMKAQIDYDDAMIEKFQKNAIINQNLEKKCK